MVSDVGVFRCEEMWRQPPLFIICAPEPAPLIVKTPNYTFITAPTVVMCSIITTNVHNDNNECVVAELRGFIVAGKCLQLQMFVMNVLSYLLDQLPVHECLF